MPDIFVLLLNIILVIRNLTEVVFFCYSFIIYAKNVIMKTNLEKVVRKNPTDYRIESWFPNPAK
jgi:hypothetical protein